MAGIELTNMIALFKIPLAVIIIGAAVLAIRAYIDRGE